MWRLMQRGSSRLGRVGIDDQVGRGLFGFGRLQPAEGIDEADAMGFDALASGGLEHDQPHQVVDQHEYQQLFHDRVDPVALEHVQAEGDLQVAQIHLDLPSQAVEFGDFAGRVRSRIQQCGDQDDLADATVRLANPPLDFANQDLVRAIGRTVRRSSTSVGWGLSHSTS